MGSESRAGATVIPTMRYRDAAAAIEWLCEAFEFEKRLVMPGEDGSIAHAQLSYGNGMIMLGSVRADESGRLQRPPGERGGQVTQSAYVVVRDPAEHHARALAAGATIAMPLQDQGYGHGYSCFDPEGHLWNFGDYDPWAGA